MIGSVDVEVGRSMRVVNVEEFGADSRGILDSYGAVVRAARTLRPGDVLYFPEGIYWTDWDDDQRSEKYVDIRSSQVRVAGNAKLVNFQFRLRGSAEASFAIESVSGHYRGFIAAGFRGDVCNDRDHLQLVSGINPFVSDSGSFQGGSISPSTDVLYPVAFSEFALVKSVDPGGYINLVSTLRFGPVYDRIDHSSKDSLRRSVARVVHFVRDVVFEGLTFDMTQATFFRTIHMQYASGIKIVNCKFKAAGNPGRHVLANDSLRIEVSSCDSERLPSADARGSSWNSFIFGAGCQEVCFENNHVFGDWQAVDFTSYGDAELGDVVSGVPSWRTTQDITVTRCRFTDCHDAVTTHPGTYDADITHNVVTSCSTGFRVRSRCNIVASNTVCSTRYGIVFSSFFDESVVAGNLLRQEVSALPQKTWVGILFMLTTSEVMTNNAVSGVLVGNNVVAGHSFKWALEFKHSWHPTPKSIEMFAEVCGNACDVVVQGNSFGSSKVYLGDNVRGVRVVG